MGTFVTDVATTFTWKHVLYRFVDSADRLLYVGITGNIDQRFTSHRGTKPWFREIADTRVEFFPDRESLELAEKVAIRTERPVYNIRDNPTRCVIIPELRTEAVMPDALPAHPLIEHLRYNASPLTCLEMHPDGFVLDGTKMQDLAISNFSTSYVPGERDVTVTFEVTLFAKRVIQCVDWLGESLPPVPEHHEPVDF